MPLSIIGSTFSFPKMKTGYTRSKTLKILSGKEEIFISITQFQNFLGKDRLDPFSILEITSFRSDFVESFDYKVRIECLLTRIKDGIRMEDYTYSWTIKLDELKRVFRDDKINYILNSNG